MNVGQHVMVRGDDLLLDVVCSDRADRPGLNAVVVRITSIRLW
jgi:hypothetical protein